VRPILRSRTIDEIATEVEGLVGSGVPEVVLTGIHLGHYGIDLSKGRAKSDWRRLWHLLDRLTAIDGDFRIRLSSLEAAEARDDLLRAMSRSARVVPHLHLCLQSGSDRILAAMRRRYRSAGFLERCDRIRRTLDRPALTTDIIVGFPGETEEDFQATCLVARTVGFAKIHIFSYSPREGTPAAARTDLIDPATLAERRARLAALETELAADFGRSLLGRRLDVLVEGADPRRPGHVVGTSCRHVPVSFPGYAPALLRRIVPIRVERLADGQVIGEPIAAESSGAEPRPSAARPRRLSLDLVS
jgi:threonylcarbamoyladenosine tRNA methylthiotransferase MtaB